MGLKSILSLFSLTAVTGAIENKTSETFWYVMSPAWKIKSIPWKYSKIFSLGLPRFSETWVLDITPI